MKARSRAKESFQILLTLLFGICAQALIVTTANAVLVIDSFVGDRDGFNGAYDPDLQTFPAPFDFSTVPDNLPTEVPKTDKDVFVEGTNPEYRHQFSVPSDFNISSAFFEIVVFDNASEALGLDPSQNGKIFLDGEELFRGNSQDFFFDAVGDFFLGDFGLSFDLGAAELFRAEIPNSMFNNLLDGEVTVRYGGESSTDAVYVDYTRITLEAQSSAIPEPSTYLLLAVGILAIVCMGYRQQRSRIGL